MGRAERGGIGRRGRKAVALAKKEEIKKKREVRYGDQNTEVQREN